MKRGRADETPFFLTIEITANSTLRPAQVEVELVESPAQPAETESKFDSLSIYYKGTRTREECIP
jgi:hypothetical protein